MSTLITIGSMLAVTGLFVFAAKQFQLVFIEEVCLVNAIIWLILAGEGLAEGNWQVIVLMTALAIVSLTGLYTNYANRVVMYQLMYDN